MSKKVTRKASITNQPTCGGPIKAGLAPRSTNFMMGVKRNHHFRGQPFKDENTDYACFEKDSNSTLSVTVNSCKNGDDGVIFLNTTGGSGNYNYEWSYEMESSGGTKSWIPLTELSSTVSYVNNENTGFQTIGYNFKCVVTDNDTGSLKTVEKKITNTTQECNENESYKFCCGTPGQTTYVGCCNRKQVSPPCERNCGQCNICK